MASKNHNLNQYLQKTQAGYCVSNVHEKKINEDTTVEGLHFRTFKDIKWFQWNIVKSLLRRKTQFGIHGVIAAYEVENGVIVRLKDWVSLCQFAAPLFVQSSFSVNQSMRNTVFLQSVFTSDCCNIPACYNKTRQHYLQSVHGCTN